MRINLRVLFVTIALSLLPACGGDGDGASQSSPASASPPPTSSPAAESPAAQVDPVALIESIPGYTYAPSPEVEEALSADLPPEAPTPAVRAVLIEGQPVGNVIIFTDDEPLSDEDLRDFLAGAEAGDGTEATAERTEIAGLPAVRAVRGDGGVTWSAAKGRYSVIVGARPEAADDLTRQVLDRLP